MAAPTPLLIYGMLQDIDTIEMTPPGYENGSVTFALCGYGSLIPRVAGTAILARVTTNSIAVDTSGRFEANLYGNDIITPAGTYYAMTVMNDNGDILQCNAYVFTGSGSLDMSYQIPFDPNQPPPPLPPLITNLLLTITPVTDTIVFPGDTYTAFKVTLPGDVLNPTIEGMVPGNLYTFIIVQDGTGYHQFLWPGNVYNATTVDPAPNSTTVQTFVADDLGELLAIGPGTYYP